MNKKTKCHFEFEKNAKNGDILPSFPSFALVNFRNKIIGFLIRETVTPRW